MSNLIHVSIAPLSHLLASRNGMLKIYATASRDFEWNMPDKSVLVLFSGDASWEPSRTDEIKNFVNSVEQNPSDAKGCYICVIYDDSGKLGADETVKLYKKATTEAVAIDHELNGNDRRTESMVKTLGGATADYGRDIARMWHHYQETQSTLEFSMLLNRLDGASVVHAPAYAYATC